MGGRRASPVVAVAEDDDMWAVRCAERKAARLPTSATARVLLSHWIRRAHNARPCHAVARHAIAQRHLFPWRARVLRAALSAGPLSG